MQVAQLTGTKSGVHKADERSTPTFCHDGRHNFLDSLSQYSDSREQDFGSINNRACSVTQSAQTNNNNIAGVANFTPSDTDPTPNSAEA